jgi:hypothetical protein
MCHQINTHGILFPQKCLFERQLEPARFLHSSYHLSRLHNFFFAIGLSSHNYQSFSCFENFTSYSLHHVKLGYQTNSFLFSGFSYELVLSFAVHYSNLDNIFDNIYELIAEYF